MTIGIKKSFFLGAVLLCAITVGFVWHLYFSGDVSVPASVRSAPGGSVNGTSPGGVRLPFSFSPDIPAGAVLSQPESTHPGEGGAPTVVTFPLRVSQNGFSETRIVVGRGTRAQIDLIASGGKYDLAVVEPIGAYVVADGGQTASFSFLAEEPGTYDFACRLFCPDMMPVSGQIIVLP